jgi:hypothetical protein
MGEWRVVLYDTGTGEWTKPINLGATDILEFSPNGEWLLASNIDLNGPMVRYRLSDDRSQTIPLRGAAATWLNAEEILYTPGDLGLWRAGVDGQNARKVASADSIPPLDVVWYAQPLPGERQVVATLGAFGGVALGIVDLESGELQRLADDVCCARYLPSGHLLYTQQPISNGTFMLRPFDTARAEFSGVEVPTGISSNPFSEVGMGADGTLAYALTTASRSDFVYYWIGTDGRLMDEQDEFSVGPMILPYGGGTSSDWGRSGIEHVELSHGGDRFVAARFADGEYRVFVNDLSRRSSQRVSFDGPSGWPTWSPDDHWIYYVGRRGGKDVILRRRADLSAAEEVVLVGKGTLADPEITPDGKRLLYYTTDDEVGHIVDLADTTRQEVFSETGAFDPMVSPDGRYVAFESQGLDVRDLDGTALYQVAPEFGDAWDPSWSADGNYLYYRDVGTLYRVPVETTPVFSQGPREVVATVGGNFHYSLHPDGERILIQGSMLSQANVSSTIQVWFNWFTTARRLAPESE